MVRADEPEAHVERATELHALAALAISSCLWRLLSCCQNVFGFHAYARVWWHLYEKR
jgi:hypothetical protein